MSKSVSQGQDYPSLSTQENDSLASNPLGMSPGASSKKLEWDSGADVGYLNLDLSKENLSTIEKIVLKGLSSDGDTEKNVIFEKKIMENSSPNDNSKNVILKSSKINQENQLKEKKTNLVIRNLNFEKMKNDSKRKCENLSKTLDGEFENIFFFFSRI